MSATATVDLRPGTDVPELPSGRILGHIQEFRRDTLGLLTRAHRTAGDLVRVRMGPIHAHYAFHPADVERVLIDNQANYTKQTKGYDTLEIFLGKGLVTSEGEFWRRQRRIAQPAFAKKRIVALADVMRRVAADQTDAWAHRARARELTHVGQDMMKVTLRIAGLTLFSVDLSDASAEIGDAITVLLRDFNRFFKSVVPFPHLWPTPANFRGRRAMATIDRLVFDIIARRRERGATEPDLLSMLMEARDEETGEGMSDRQLRDEIVTMLVAGHETTANALIWTLVLLSQHPRVREAVEAEIAQVVGDGPLELEHVPRLVYTEQVLKESMRLYPPVWGLARRAREPDVLSGYELPAGAYVIMSPYVTHRHPTFWPDPERFDPGRFEGGDRGRAKGAYFPFAAGPRKCIGDHFARMEAIIILGTLLGRFRARLVPGQNLEAEPSVTLRPKNDIWMFVEAQGRSAS